MLIILKSVIFTIILMMTMINTSLCQQQENFINLNNTSCNNKRIERIDQKFIELIGIGMGGRRYPINKMEIKSFCSETDKILNEIEKFLNECLRNDVSTISKIFIYSTKKYWRTLCRGNNKRINKKQQKLLKITECFNKKIDKIDCLEQFSNKTRNLIRYRLNGTDKINHICCNQVELMKCAENSLLSLPCMTDNGFDTLMELFHNIKGDIVNYGCGGDFDQQQSDDQCKKLKLNNKQLLKDSKIRINHKLRSYFFAILFTIKSIN